MPPLQGESPIRAMSASWSDRLGIWASGLCVVHCLLTPVLLSMSAVFAHFLPSEEGTHRTLALLVSLLGCLALVKGFRAHRRLLVPSLMAGGLACVFFGAFAGNHLAAHWQEVAITAMGSFLMIAAHRLNHTFCRSCSCTER